MTTVKSINGKLHILERSLTGTELELDAKILEEQMAVGTTTSISRDSNGRVSSVTATLPGGEIRTITMTRGAGGKVSSVRVQYSTLAIDKTYTFTRDSSGRIELFTYADTP